MRRLQDLLKRFRRDESGAFLVIFAVLALVLIATSGAVVDFTYMQTARSRAQNALDAAALALQAKVGTYTVQQFKDKSKAIVDERIADSAIVSQVNSATPDTTNGKLTLQAQITVPTAFIQLIGIRTITAQLTSQATKGSKNLEISVALDITGSMAPCDYWGNCDYTKINGLKSATHTLINEVIQPVQTPTFSKMAIVPWSAGVNVGTYANNIRGTPNTTTKNITAASWAVSGTAKSVSAVVLGNPTKIKVSSHGLSTGDTIYLTGTNGVSCWRCTSINGAAYVITKVDANNFTIPFNSTGYGSWTSGGTSTKCQVANCEEVVTSNSHGYANGDPVHIESVSGTTELNGNGYFAANVTTNTMSLTGSFGPNTSTYSSGGKIWCGSYGCSWRTFTAADGSINSIAVSTCVSERDTHTFDNTAPSVTKLGMNYAPSGQCPSVTVQPLTDDATALGNFVDTLVAGGSTAGQLGLAWGWYMIDHDFGYLWTSAPNPTKAIPLAYGSANLLKVVVLMTDGDFNTSYCSGVIAQDAGSGSGSDSDHINCNSTNGLSSAQAPTMCQAIKDKGIELYTVGFQLGTNTTAKTLLSNCATDTDHALTAESTTELNAAFHKIAQNLNSLRLSM